MVRRVAARRPGSGTDPAEREALKRRGSGDELLVGVAGRAAHRDRLQRLRPHDAVGELGAAGGAVPGAVATAGVGSCGAGDGDGAGQGHGTPPSVLGTVDMPQSSCTGMTVGCTGCNDLATTSVARLESGRGIR